MNKISINPSVIARLLGTMAFLLVLLSIGGQFSRFVLGHSSLKGLVPLFYVDEEQNIPTYFTVLLMFFSALILAFVAILNKKQKIPHVSKWVILSLGFLLMAFDEAFKVHEQLIYLIRPLLSNGEHKLGIFYFAWVIPGILLVILLGIFFLKFWLHLPAKTRFRFLTAAIFYIGGVIGFELIGGSYHELYRGGNWTYSIIVTFEESLEMTGLIIFIWALLKYCEENYKEVLLRFGSQ